MNKYLVLYKSSVSAKEQMGRGSPEQAKAGMDLWMSWAKKAGAAIIDLGMPLGNGLTVTEGGTRPSDSQVVGFSILQGESIKAIADLLKGHPHFRAPGSSIEVLESLPMPGLPRT